MKTAVSGLRICSWTTDGGDNGSLGEEDTFGFAIGSLEVNACTEASRAATLG